MSRRVAVALMTTGLSLFPMTAARADVDWNSDDIDDEVGTRIDSPIVDARREASGSSPRGPVCTWEPFLGDGLVPIPPEFLVDGRLVRDIDTGEYVTRAGPGTETPYWRTCEGSGRQLMWVNNGVDIDVLIDAAYAEAIAKIPDPALDMNPEPSAGGVVNIGLWLAVDDPGQVSATAELGPQWATVVARFERTVWDMGNGDTVECEGLGVPITDLDTEAQGPCGYTYDWPGSHDNSVTGHWAITYTSSAGSGVLEPIETSTSYGYGVREIQTVYAAGGSDG
jgi:hypothetical protein